ncbi:MAG: 4-hydroxythreonine-4-phosphate dehydrogenase PdxA [Aquimonas sp.]|nr:4-hydroxythreonine-4-phosphate dehydrogenase PdxA [Aquimonas sp.]
MIAPPLRSAGPARLLLLPGEPAGIGPELALQLALRPRNVELVALADPQHLLDLTERLGLALQVQPWSGGSVDRRAGHLPVLAEPVARPPQPGTLDRDNVPHVLRCIDRGVALCLSGEFDGLVTGPVHKGIINATGEAFSGMTERLAAQAGGADVVMMLASPTLRVALVTTHLPLRAVPDAITGEAIARVARSLHAGLRRDFGIAAPRIGVLGLNPHAGEDGHLGREEIEVIAPCLDALRTEGLDLVGPLPADTAFLPQLLPGLDAILAMYHDQGLPVLKYSGFELAVNISLGLPFVRVAVDHGTALALAGSGRADVSSLAEALATAERMALNRRSR